MRLHKDTLSKLVIINTFLSILLLLLTFDEFGDRILEDSDLLIEMVFVVMPFVLLWSIHRFFFKKWDHEIAPVLHKLQKKLKRDSEQDQASPSD